MCHAYMATRPYRRRVADVNRGETPDSVGTITGSSVPESTNAPIHSIPVARSSARRARRLDDLRVWAPSADSVALVATDESGTATTVAMTPAEDDPQWWLVPTPVADTGAVRYSFSIDDGDPVPDPRSLRLPEGVHGPSEIHDVDDAIWTDQQWAGRSIHGAVVYEMHIGTFTSEGTFAAATDRLDHLVDLGVDFVEVLPVNAFNGVHGWGYDGVGWYAVHEPYGGPDAFARFIDAAHARGLGVVLDAVYNHLGPSGNYLDRFGPYLSTGLTSWGSSVNLSDADSDEVRAYILDNALRWFEEFHIDALRLDAVHALVDHTAVHILEELAARTADLSARLGRPLALIAESDLNDPRLILPRELGGFGLDAQWDDDIHHAVHTAVSGERQGYYADFGSFECLAKVLRGGFFHDGTYSSFRRRRHGKPMPTDLVPASALFAYTCNHDQIGNRAIGDRPSAYLDDGQLAIKAALILLSPFTPMLFMGEEWAARTPFQFFTSHPEPELGEAVRTGRRNEFAEHGWDSEDVPDPQDPATFDRSKLDWGELDADTHRRMYEFYRDLIALRHTEPDISAGGFDSVAVDYDEDAQWFAMHRGAWSIVCNLGTDAVPIPLTVDPTLSWGEVVTDGGSQRLGPHAVAVGRRR